MNLLKYFNNYQLLDKYIFIISNNNKSSNESIKYHLKIINNVALLLLFEFKSPLILDMLYNNNIDILYNILNHINFKCTGDINYIINLFHILYTNIIDSQQLLKNKYKHSNFTSRINQLSIIHQIFIDYFSNFCLYNNLNINNYLHLFYYHDMIFINHDTNNKVYNYYIDELYKSTITSERSKKVFKLITNIEL